MNVNQEEILWWNGMRAGNEKNLRSLYHLYYNDLLRYGLYLTDDAALSKEYINLLFLGLWNNRQKLPEVTNPKAYTVTSYKNKIIFRKKNASDANVVYLNNDNNPSATMQSYEETLIKLQEYEKLKKNLTNVLASLTERQRQLIVLRFIEEMSYEQIAAYLNLSVRTVYNSIHKSLKMLRTRVEKKDFFFFFLVL